ncbi:MAG: SpoIIE family protein phosphatase [Spirochaetales bacterium]|nr:SpoIIE family protein phosphatase [Spirochaetales bacterium]
MKKSFNTRIRILLTVLPLALVPIIVLTIYTGSSFYKRSLNQNKEFYRDIISQVTTNVDFYYNQYAISFADITQSSVFQKIVNRPEMTSIEDKSFTIDGKNYILALEEFLVSKFNGVFLMLELGRKDTVNNRSYKHFFIGYSNISFDVEKLKEDPVFLKMSENLVMEPILATSEAIRGAKGITQPIFFFPHIKEGSDKIDELMLIIETPTFLSSLYEKNVRLKFGTLYMLDQFGNVQERNHPHVNDYYNFDKERNCYVLEEGDDPDDPFEGMSFAEYRMLNVDEKILQLPKVQEQIQIAEEDGEPSCEIVKFKGKKYLSIVSIAENSLMRVIYFHPIRQLSAPIMRIIYIIMSVAILISVLVVVISIIFSHFLTNPIKELNIATRKICNGDYSILLTTEEFFGEFIDLSDSFNHMVGTISNYRENMEKLVKNRTEELNKNVEQLTEANEQNRRELAMAQRIQSSLVPKVFPETRLLQFSSKYMPMEALGGDLYDVYQISDKVFSVMILDVCGHGVPAALITTMAKISFNTNTKKSKDPSEVVFNVNNELYDSINGNGDYFTAFYGVIDMEKGMLYYSNAGHNTIFLAHADGTMDQLENNGPVVGVVKDLEFPSVGHQLKNGDRLVLYTDGVIEARDEQAALYGEERLMDIISKNMNSEVKDFTEHVFTDLQAFCGNSPRCDDIALFAVDIVGIE